MADLNKLVNQILLAQNCSFAERHEAFCALSEAFRDCALQNFDEGYKLGKQHTEVALLRTGNIGSDSMLTASTQLVDDTATRTALMA